MEIRHFKWHMEGPYVSHAQDVAAPDGFSHLMTKSALDPCQLMELFIRKELLKIIVGTDNTVQQVKLELDFTLASAVTMDSLTLTRDGLLRLG